METAQTTAAPKVRKSRAAKTEAATGTIIDGGIKEVEDSPDAQELQKIVTIDKSTEVAKFNPIRAKAAELLKEISSTVYDIATADGEDTARALRRRCVGMRTSAAKVYQAWNRPVLDAQAEMRLIVKGIEDMITPVEAVIDAAITEKERVREEEKQRKIAAEQARIAALRAKITSIAALPTAAAKCQRSADIQVLVATMDTITVDEDTYGEFLEEATALHTEVRAQLEEMIQAAVTREAETARQAEEAQRLTREREALELAATRRTKISAIQAAPLQAFGKTSEEIGHLSAMLKPPHPDDFGDLFLEAQAAHALAQKQMGDVLEGARASEAANEAARLAREETERLRREADARELARQTEAAAQTQLLRNQQDAFEKETADARARIKEEDDRLASQRRVLEEQEAALTKPPAAAETSAAPDASGPSSMPAGPNADKALDPTLSQATPDQIADPANAMFEQTAMDIGLASQDSSVPARPTDLEIVRIVALATDASEDLVISWLTTFNRDDCLVALEMEEIPA